MPDRPDNEGTVPGPRFEKSDEDIVIERGGDWPGWFDSNPDGTLPPEYVPPTYGSEEED